MTQQNRKVVVFTNSQALFKTFQKVITAALADLQWVENDRAVPPTEMMVAFVDGKWQGNRQELLVGLAARGIYTVLVDDEAHIGDTVPEALVQGTVDDLILQPLRSIEILGKIKHAAHLERVREVSAVNLGIKDLIERFEEDLRTARAIQRTLIPEKFAPVHGFKVAHKYLSGLKSGGDYLDFFEFTDNTHVGVLMTDSTGYGLSSAFMSVILKLAVKLSKDEFRSPSATIAKIFEELKVTMKPRENLSIFYGVLNRKTFEFTFAGCGSVRFVHLSERAGSGVALVERTPGGEPLIKDQPFALKDQTLALLPSDRLVVLSDGFAETFESEREGAKKAVERQFNKVYGEDPIELINNLVFRVKNALEAEDDMPAQDCSVMVIDVEKRAMRLAR